MDFFVNQEAARRQTRLLVFLLIIAVAAIVAAVNAAAVFTAYAEDSRRTELPTFFFVIVSIITLAVIGIGMLIEISAVAGGGATVARAFGGRRLSSATTDLAERRLINIVEEMAIASGITVPQVFVMDREAAINAFAAGFSPNEATITVTRGALNILSRDELQGVIGHEFSHILNGDMRLNMRIVGLLGGILMLAMIGRSLVDSRNEDNDQYRRHSPFADERDKEALRLNAVWSMFGYALIATGYIGVFFARLIKAAIARQREFLADASSLQFTRNPDGIGGALAKIAQAPWGARVDHPLAEKASHMFFGEAITAKYFSLLATHPPIGERLQKIYGRAITPEDIIAPAALRRKLSQAPPDGDSDQADASGGAPAQAPQAATASSFVGASAGSGGAVGNRAPDAGLRAVVAATPETVSGTVGTVSTQQMDYAVALLAKLPAAAREQLRSAQGAMLTMYGLVLARGGPVKPVHAQMLNARGVDAGQAFAVAEKLQALDKTTRLPLITLAIPALKPLPEPERLQFLALLQELIGADRRVTLEEFVVSAMLTAALGTGAGRAVPVKYHSLAPLAEDAGLVLSLVAHAARSDTARAFAGGVKELGLPLALTEVRSISIKLVTEALGRLNQLAPLQKPRLVRALGYAALPDGAISLVEAELLRAICATLDSPLPPVIAAMEYVA